MAKKNQDIVDAASEVVDAQMDAGQTFNPLLVALHNNDKKNLFKTNVTTAFIKTGFPLFDYYFGSVVNVHDELGNLIGQEPRVGQAVGTFNLLIGNSGSGKALPNSMTIPTPDGYKYMKDIKVGDYVIDKHGKPTLVSGVYPQGKKQIFNIHFSDGRAAECSADHLWEVSNRDGKKTVLSTSEIRDAYFQHPDVTYYVDTLTHPVDYNAKEISCDPYLYGVFLTANANAVHFIGLGEKVEQGCPDTPLMFFSIHKDEVLETIAEKLNAEPEENANHRYAFKKEGKYVTANDVFPEYAREMYAGMIPFDLLHNSYDVRMELLRGLMDADGTIASVDPMRDVYFHCNTSYLPKFVVALVRNLGYNATITTRKYSDIGSKWYDILLQVPASLKRQLFTDSKRYKIAASCDDDDDKFKRIKITGVDMTWSSEECTCIYVENEDHLFLTDQYIPTHNTTLGAQIAANIIRQYTYANAVHFDCEQRFDTSRCETITKLPSSYFDTVKGERYLIKSGSFGLDTIQEMIVKMYVQKMKLKDQLTVPSGFKDEFGRDVMILQPTVIIIDSITTVLNETFNPDSAKEAADAEGLRTNTEGARDAKTLKGFFKDIIPLCKEANIIVYGINHINSNMSMNAFIPVAKQQNYLKQDESIPGGRTMIYYPFNIVKLTAKPSDDFTEEGDGFAGHMVMVEPIKSSSNQSGNNSKGISFELVFSHKEGFDNLRSMVMYGRDHGLIEGNKARLKFRDDPDCSFTWRNLEREKDEKPIYENIKKYVIPTLNQHLPFIEPSSSGFDSRSLDY